MLIREYLDETDPGDAQLLAVGGFVGPDNVWDDLESAWLEALPEGIDFFHATDCFRGNNQFEPSKGFYLERRVELLDVLTDLICRTNIMLVCQGIDVPAYKAHAPKKKVNEFLVNKYVAPFESAISIACQSCLPMPPGFAKGNFESDDLCSLFFEENEYLNTALDAIQRMRNDEILWWRNRIGNVTHGTKFGKNAIPLLQVADLGVFLGGKLISDSPDGVIPWTRYYNKLQNAGRVLGKPGKISKGILDTLRGIHETIKLEKESGKSYWDEGPLT